ncbi:MAG: phosphatase PAP2 family protein [Planctomycetota bacterium]|nr:phosphatase PAP2 family protein [Planctomycetota bacterium]
MKSAWRGELALLLVGFILCCALIVRAASFGLVLESILTFVTYGGLVFYLVKKESLASHRVRLVMAYLFTFWFYSAIERMTPALGFPVRDGGLRKIDELLFSEMPALSFQSWSSDAWTEFFSLCYLTYHIYFHCVLGFALWTGKTIERLGNIVFLAFALGFVGYLLVPAIGPAAAFPELFLPLPEGYLIADLNRGVVAEGSSVYDVFPSLHGLITATLLFFDFREHRTRFWIMLGPCLGLLVSTLYLRYHYATDLLAAAICFVVVAVYIAAWDRKEHSLLYGGGT